LVNLQPTEITLFWEESGNGYHASSYARERPRFVAGGFAVLWAAMGLAALGAPTATNTVEATVAVGVEPVGVAITPDGTHAYVANLFSTLSL
jgi:DNA-binding beta-propeller fold protein YncE